MTLADLKKSVRHFTFDSTLEKLSMQPKNAPQSNRKMFINMWCIFITPATNQKHSSVRSSIFFFRGITELTILLDGIVEERVVNMTDEL